MEKNIKKRVVRGRTWCWELWLIVIGSSQKANGIRKRRLIKANALTKRGFEWNATVEHFLMNVRTIKTVVGNH